MSDDKRIAFIRWIVGTHEDSYLGLASRGGESNAWTEGIFNPRTELPKIENFLRQNELVSDLYFCPTPLDAPRRTKDNITRSNVLWSDLDSCEPDQLLVPPTLVTETSPGHYQCFWRLEESVHADEAELLNKRIAYRHSDQGADRSGWDLSQLLRIPNTRNFKYPETPVVRLHTANQKAIYSIQELKDKYGKVDVTQEASVKDIPLPVDLPNRTADSILNTLSAQSNPRIRELFDNPPITDRSRALWELILLLLEAELSIEETFIVARDSKCNKFGSNPHHLWKDILRAKAKIERDEANKNSIADIPDTDLIIPDGSILTEEEWEIANSYRSLVDEYYEWASKATDAAPQYHVATGIIILSSLLSGSLRLYTQYGEIKPNLWVMIMGDTTTSRKSTSMEMGTDILDDINPECLLATDGTIEGLLAAMTNRSSKVSLFHRDEVSGLLLAMDKKDYNAGMLEAFTKLYDGKRMRRILRKEQIEVRDPVFVMLTGGTRTGIFSALSSAHISSGFAPRFVYISAEQDPSRRRGLGPRTINSNEKRIKLVSKFEDVYLQYNDTGSTDPFALPKKVEVSLTEEAWQAYNHYDFMLVDLADKSSIPEFLTPMMARLSMSGLKIAMLLAASRGDEKIVVDVPDIIKAFSYVDSWKAYSFEVVVNAGRSNQETQITECYTTIANAGSSGLSRAQVMQIHRLTSRNADLVFGTLEQRNLIVSNRPNGKIVYYAVSKLNKDEFV